MAAPLMHGITIADDRCRRRVDFQALYRDHTQPDAAFRRKRGKDRLAIVTVAAGQHYTSPGTIHVEGDASSASYFLAAGAIAGGPVRVEGIGKDSIQGDIRFAEALQQMGATITMGDNWIEAKSNGVLKAIDADFNHIPDAAMTIAVAALYADGPSTLRNIASWRVKETDRIAAMATELRKLGATVEEGADYLRVTPPTQILVRPSIPTTTTAWRCASRWRRWMALRAAANQMRINDPKCVAKNFSGILRCVLENRPQRPLLSIRLQFGIYSAFPALVLSYLQRIFMCRDFGGSMN